MRRPKWLAAAVIGWAALARPAPAPLVGRGPRPLRITPSAIEVRLLYRVPPIRIEGGAAAGSLVVVVVRGEQKEETFNKKVRAGPIWISSGKVHVAGAPSVFLSFSSAPIDSGPPRQALDEQALTPAGIRRLIRVDAGGDPVDEEALRANYLSLKTKAGVYQVHNGGVELGRGEGSGVRFTVRFEWPRKAPPGTYTVTVFEWNGSELKPVAETTLPVLETGFAGWITEFAARKPAQYGIACVLLAVVAGFGIDFLAARMFPRGRRPVH